MKCFLIVGKSLNAEDLLRTSCATAEEGAGLRNGLRIPDSSWRLGR